MNVSKALINWYLTNQRDLPWRSTRDPYKIWLSEIILQQTRVEQGKPYYLNFIQFFPTVFELAAASEEEVLKLWQGLGYYSRARNLHVSAKYIAEELGGRFPADYKSLLRLKGVGDYTASAIASISYNEPVAVVDGNVYRVLSRIFGIEAPINSTEGIKQFKELAEELLDRDSPSAFNQGLMEFGAVHCKPRLPECETCPFAAKCVAFNQNKIAELPVKLRKQKIRKRHFNYLVFLSEEKETIVQQRKDKGIWQGLYEFPLVETATETNAENLVQEDSFATYSRERNVKVQLFNEKPIVHKLSHQHIYTKFWILNCRDLKGKGVPVRKLTEFPVPKLIDNFIDAFSY